LQAHGHVDAVHKLPESITLEGAGDCVFDATRRMFWMGYGPRSDATAHDPVADMFGVDTLALELVDPRFYHLDTCFCPLPDGSAFWFPAAFDEYAGAGGRCFGAANQLDARYGGVEFPPSLS